MSEVHYLEQLEGQDVEPGAAPRSGATGKRKRTKPVSMKEVLAAIAECHACGIENPQRGTVALLAGYGSTETSGSKRMLSKMKGKGLIEYPSPDTVRLTNAGFDTDAAKGVVPPKDNTEVHERIKQHLEPSAVKIFEVIKDGRPYDRMEVAKKAGYSDKPPMFKKILSTFLCSRGILHYPDTKTIQLTDSCFLFPMVIKVEDGN